MQNKKRRMTAVVLTVMLIATLIPQMSYAATSDGALTSKDWSLIKPGMETHRAGMGYEAAGLCTGYVTSAINANYGVDIGGNTTVDNLENRLKDRGVKCVESGRTSGSVSSNMNPGDILIFKYGSSGTHCGILGENGYMYHNSSSAGVQKLKLSEWMSYPDAGKNCDRYNVYKGVAQSGYAYLVKSSANTSISANNDCYSLAGAKYTVKNSNGTTVGTLTTDATGKTNTLELPAGTYTVKETTAPEGFWLDTQTYKVTVKSGETSKVNAKDMPASDPVSVIVKKFNKETGKKYTSPEAKANFGASLENAQYEFKYYDIPASTVTAKGGINSAEFKTYLSKQTAKNSWTFATNENGFAYYSEKYKVSGDKLYYDASGDAALPIGVYTVQEVKAPSGYLIDNTLYIKQVEKEGSTATVWSDNMPESPEAIKRGDISLRKIDAESQKAMANIPFKITAKSNGEIHYIMTDENGQASTASDWNEHELDNTLEGLTPESGVWFGVESALSQDKGALPYDTYVIEELECDANKGKELFKTEFTVYRDNHTFDFGNIENNEVEIVTEAISLDTDSRVTYAKKDVTIEDEVTYHDAVKNKTYEYVAYIVDKDTGNVIADKTIDVTPTASFGTFTVKFNIDTSEYVGHELVVCGKMIADDVTCGIHEDVNNAKQTISVVNPELQTTATDSATNMHIGLNSEKTTIVDKTTYKNLIKGTTLKLKGTVMDKETGKPLLINEKEVTSEKKFTVDKSNDSVELEFNLDTSALKGKSLVIYEELYWGDDKIGEHKDINSEAQTVHFPAIKTSALLKDTNSKYGLAGEETVVVDTVEYTNLVLGETYKAVGMAIDKETGEPVCTETFITEFVATENSGEAYLEAAFDATAYAGKDVVMFEELYLVTDKEDVLIAEHKDLEDESQTVHFSKIGTQALFDNGKNIIKPNEKTKITDTVSFTNLEPNQKYRVKGVLMDKETNDLFRAVDLNPHTDSETAEKETESFIKVESDSDVIEFTLVMEGWVGDVEKITAEKVSDGLYKVTKQESLVPAEQEEAFSLFVIAQVFSGYVPDVYVDDKLCSMDGEDTLVIPTKVGDKATLTYKWREGTEKDYSSVNVTDIDIDVNSVKGETEFTAEESNGTVNVEFLFNSSQIDNATIVVFEELYLVTTNQDGSETETLVATHKDINDAAQTVTIKDETNPKTGVMISFMGVMMLMCIGTGTYVVMRRRKVTE